MASRRRSPGSLGGPTGARDGFRGAFYALTFGYPVLWILGAGGLYWVVLVVPAVWYLLHARISGLAWAILALPAILFLSSPIGLTATSASPGRLVGLAANAAVWISVAAIVLLAESGEESLSLTRAFIVIGSSQGFITLLAVIAYPIQLPIPLANSFASSVPGGVGAFMENFLYFPSWLGEEQFRSAGIMGQPTWAGAVGALALLACLYSLTADRGWWRLLALISIPLTVVSIELSLSRAASVGMLAALAAGVVVYIGRKSSIVFWCLLTLTGVGILIALISNTPALLRWVASINSQREGSFDARFQIYLETWRLIVQHPLPLLGYGVKPADEELVASVATHSAYLGMLFRGGLLGLIALVAVYLTILNRSVKAGSLWATSACLFIAVWSLLEDVDSGHFVPIGLALALSWAIAAERGPTDLSSHARL